MKIPLVKYVTVEDASDKWRLQTEYTSDLLAKFTIRNHKNENQTGNVLMNATSLEKHIADLQEMLEYMKTVQA